MNQPTKMPAQPSCRTLFRAATLGILVLAMLLAAAGSRAACGDPRSSRSGTFTVDETDTVKLGGKTYKGTFDFKAFDPGGHQVAKVKGTALGTRITVD
jgi:hypothetical protein